jgi:hypothetical protein
VSEDADQIAYAAAETQAAEAHVPDHEAALL